MTQNLGKNRKSPWIVMSFHHSVDMMMIFIFLRDYVDLEAQKKEKP